MEYRGKSCISKWDDQTRGLEKMTLSKYLKKVRKQIALWGKSIRGTQQPRTLPSAEAEVFPTGRKLEWLREYPQGRGRDESVGPQRPPTGDWLSPRVQWKTIGRS